MLGLNRKGDVGDLVTKIKVGFILSTLTYGGAEHRIFNLIQWMDPSLVSFSGVALRHGFPLPDFDLPKNMPPIYLSIEEKRFSNHPNLVVLKNFRGAVERICRDSDLVFLWGISGMADMVPLDFKGRIIAVSLGFDEQTRQFASQNSLLTRYLTANSSSSRRAFPLILQDQVRVICNGFSPARVSPEINRGSQRQRWGIGLNDKIAVYCGRIEHGKGLGFLIQGISELGKDWKLVLVGATECRMLDEDYYEALMKKKIPGRYRLLPWTKDIGSCLNAADVYCQLSPEEGFSNALAEAWLAGVPTVYTENTGAILDLGEMGYPVPRHAGGNIIARSIIQSVKDEKMKKYARAVISTYFSLEDSVKQWERYFMEMHRVSHKRRTLAVILEGSSPEDYVLPDSFLRQVNEIDWCGLVIMGTRTWGPNKPLVFSRIDDCVCPVFGIKFGKGIPDLMRKFSCRKAIENNVGDDCGKLLAIVRNVRPEQILDFSGTICHFSNAVGNIPVITVYHGSDKGECSDEMLRRYMALKLNSGTDAMLGDVLEEIREFVFNLLGDLGRLWRAVYFGYGRCTAFRIILVRILKPFSRILPKIAFQYFFRKKIGRTWNIYFNCLSDLSFRRSCSFDSKNAATADRTGWGRGNAVTQIAKKRILYVADVKNWVFDHWAKALQRRLRQVDIDIGYVETRARNEYWENIVKSRHYDLIWVTSENYPLKTDMSSSREDAWRRYVCLRNKAGTKMIVSVHHVLTEEDIRRKEKFFSFWNGVLSNDRSNVNRFLKAGLRCAYLPVGVDRSIFECKIPFELRPFRILFVSSKSRMEHKGYALFLELKKRMRHEGVEYYQVVGDLPWGHCRSVGDMARLYNGCRLYVCLSKSETVPMPLIESASCGVVPLSTDVGYARELINENGFLLPRNVEAFEDKIRYLLGDKDLLTQMSRKVRTDSERWDWDRLVGAYGDYLLETAVA